MGSVTKKAESFCVAYTKCDVRNSMGEKFRSCGSKMDRDRSERSRSIPLANELRAHLEPRMLDHCCS